MSGASDLQAQKNTLETEVRDLQLRMKELERVEQTYEKEYLDKKQHPANKGILYHIGLHTAQDFTIALFCISYLFFSCVMIMYATIFSTSKFITFFITTIVMVVIAQIFGIMLITYG